MVAKQAKQTKGADVKDELYSTSEVADMLPVTQRTLQNYIREGVVQAQEVQHGRSRAYRLSRAEISRLAEEFGWTVNWPS